MCLCVWGREVRGYEGEKEGHTRLRSDQSAEIIMSQSTPLIRVIHGVKNQCEELEPKEKESYRNNNHKAVFKAEIWILVCFEEMIPDRNPSPSQG